MNWFPQGYRGSHPGKDWVRCYSEDMAGWELSVCLVDTKKCPLIALAAMKEVGDAGEKEVTGLRNSEAWRAWTNCSCLVGGSL